MNKTEEAKVVKNVFPNAMRASQDIVEKIYQNAAPKIEDDDDWDDSVLVQDSDEDEDWSDDVEVKKTASDTHPDNADKIIEPRLITAKPGRVKTHGKFIIHTHLAHRLFYGRRKGVEVVEVDGKEIRKTIMPIIGVVRFGTNINTIYDMAQLDDPYADAKLLEIENSFIAIRKQLDTNIQALAQILGDTSEMNITPAFSIKPITLPLEFRTPYFGYEATRIVKYFDRLVLLALTTKQTGDILDSDWNRIVNKTGTKIRGVFLLSSQYHVTGVVRDDFAANNGRARAAIEKYGELPQDILEGKRRAKHAPKIRRASK